MGQIVKRKKKGRPPKSDLARRPHADETELESRVRRSLRRRNARYNFVNYDDFIDDDDYFEENDNENDDEEDEEELEERRREKKVKLVVKLNHTGHGAHARRGGASDDDEQDVSEAEGREEDDDRDDYRGRKVTKRRRIGRASREDEEDELEDELEDDGEQPGIDDTKLLSRSERELAREDSKELDSPPGTPSAAASSVPLPDKKKLELILDKLQKKDTYGVYAEPVDPEELPDYHDVIERPMDFSTVRKKLANDLYSTLEQLESDVFLICSNAMQYNAPDTIYHKQARTIQELGRKKFQKLRADYERSERERKLEHKGKSDYDSPEKELKSEQRMRPSPRVKKQMKKPTARPLQESVGSDFSAGAAPAIGGDALNVSAADQAGNGEWPSTNDGVLDGSPFLAESLDKGEELSTGKGLSAKIWRKTSAVDENRRATYNMPNESVARADCILTTFDSEIKQLVAVGLHAENSYARSLAHFAATLGPIAWKVASERIEQVLPAGSKFGRGWVGEYETLPTPILLLDKRLSRDYPFLPNLSRNINPKKDFKVPAPRREVLVSKSVAVRNSGLEVRPTPAHQNSVPSAVTSSGLKPNIAGSANHQRPESPASRYLARAGNKVVKQFELNSLPPTSQCNTDYVTEKKHMDNPYIRASRPGEVNSKSLNHPTNEVSVPEAAISRTKEMTTKGVNDPLPVPLKQADTTGMVARGLSNGKVVREGLESSKLGTPKNGLPNEMQRAPAFFLRQDQGLSDPVPLMRMLAEKGQKQQSPQNRSGDNTAAMAPPVSSARRDTSGNAATAAASAWMSIGGGGFKQANGSSSPRDQISTTTDSPYGSPRDPVQLTRMSAKKPQKHSADDTPATAPPVPPIGRDSSGNAATAMASTWMSIGGRGFEQAAENSSIPRNQIPSTTNSPYNSPRDLHNSQMARIRGEFPAYSGAAYFQREKGSSPLPLPFMQQQSPVGSNNEAPISNRQMVFPQFVNANLARFQAQTPWRGIAPHTQQRTKQDTLPPDLNIGFQSPGSPVKQSSGVKMEQQPDLALQL